MGVAKHQKGCAKQNAKRNPTKAFNVANHHHGTNTRQHVQEVRTGNVEEAVPVEPVHQQN
jgi:hypothetical protein